MSLFYFLFLVELQYPIIASEILFHFLQLLIPFLQGFKIEGCLSLVIFKNVILNFFVLLFVYYSIPSRVFSWKFQALINFMI